MARSKSNGPKNSSAIIYEIDAVLAGRCAFKEEELDFIVDHGIKCRLGRDAGEEEG